MTWQKEMFTNFNVSSVHSCSTVQPVLQQYTPYTNKIKIMMRKALIMIFSA
jgi:hypothetical protein